MKYRVTESHTAGDFVFNKGLVVDIVSLGNEGVQIKIRAGMYGTALVSVPFEVFTKFYIRHQEGLPDSNSSCFTIPEEQKQEEKQEEKPLQHVFTVFRREKSWEALPEGYILVNSENNCSCMGKKPCWMHHDSKCKQERRQQF